MESEIPFLQWLVVRESDIQTTSHQNVYEKKPINFIPASNQTLREKLLLTYKENLP